MEASVERQISQNAPASSPSSSQGLFLGGFANQCHSLQQEREKCGKPVPDKATAKQLKNAAGAALARVLSGHRPTRFRTGLSSPFESQRGPSRSQRRRERLRSPAQHPGGGWMNSDPKPTFRRGAAITSLLLKGSCGAPPSLSLPLCLKSAPQVS